MDSVLVLGGCGFIGRNLIQHLTEQKLATKIRAVDKTMPCLCNMPEALEDLYDDEKGSVEFIQADLSKPEGLEKAFADGPWNYVINVAGEAKPGHSSKIYEENLTNVCVGVAKKAAGCKHFIEISDAAIFTSKKGSATENNDEKPKGKIAKAHLAADNQIKAIENLVYTIIRPSIVYGPGDKYGLMARLVQGWVYRKLGDTMKLLWNEKVPMNCVHVTDLVRFICFCLANTEKTQKDVIILTDDTHLNQGAMNGLVSELFGIKTGFVGKALNMAAKVNLKAACTHVNGLHMDPWGEVCREAGIHSTPITPYLSKEQLEKSGIDVSNQKAKDLGFSLENPVVTKELLTDMIQGYVDLKLVPAL